MGKPSTVLPALPARPPRKPRLDPRKATLYGGAAALGAAYWAWLSKAVSGVPRIWCGDGDLKRRVLPYCTVLHEPYNPSPWALNTHFQNILGFIRGADINPRYKRQLVIAHDGGTLGLDWFRGCDSLQYGPADTPILLVLHGINGGSHEGYCKWVCAEAYRKKRWRAVVLNYRGCAGLPLTSPRGYAATLTHDVHYAITSIKARFPSAPLFAVGYSLGGLLLTKYLAESDTGLHDSLAAQQSLFDPYEGSGLEAAAVVSSPVCLHNSSANLGVPWTPGYLYNLAVAFKLREFIRHHELAIRQNVSVLNYEKALSKWDVGGMEDHGGLQKTFGFETRQEYYDAVASLNYIPHITTPTLFLVSKDDPFLGVLPDQECAANPHTLLAATKRGGHVAFLTGLWPFGPAYMDTAVLQFLEQTWKHLPARAVRPATHTAMPRTHSAAHPDTQGDTQHSVWGEPVCVSGRGRVWLDASVVPHGASSVQVTRHTWDAGAAAQPAVAPHTDSRQADTHSTADTQTNISYAHTAAASGQSGRVHGCAPDTHSQSSSGEPAAVPAEPPAQAASGTHADTGAAGNTHMTAQLAREDTRGSCGVSVSVCAAQNTHGTGVCGQSHAMSAGRMGPHHMQAHQLMTQHIRSKL